MSDEDFPTLDELAERHLLAALERAGGSKVVAARLLGVNLKTVYNMLKRIKERAGEK